MCILVIRVVFLTFDLNFSAPVWTLSCLQEKGKVAGSFILPKTFLPMQTVYKSVLSILEGKDRKAPMGNKLPSLAWVSTEKSSFVRLKMHHA